MVAASGKKLRFRKRRRQYAALPVRVNVHGQIEVLLLTSRETRRWVIPKGWPMRKRTPGEAAAREAYEEAGVEGTIRPARPVGRYCYVKRTETGGFEVAVKVFLLWVERQRGAWPEQAERETRWFSPDEAGCLVAEPELAALLRGVAGIAGGGA